MCSQWHLPDLTGGYIEAPASPALCHCLISMAALTTTKCPIRGNCTSEIQPCISKLLCISGCSIPLPHLLHSDHGPRRTTNSYDSATGHNSLKQAPLHKGSSRVISALAGVTMVMRSAEKPFLNVDSTQVHTAVWGDDVILESELCFMEQRVLYKTCRGPSLALALSWTVKSSCQQGLHSLVSESALPGDFHLPATSALTPVCH